MKVKILIDTSSGLSLDEANAFGYEMLPLPFLLDEVEYNDYKLNKNEFYEKLKGSKDIHTSQAPMSVVMETFDRLLKENDYVMYFPITSGLSSSYQTALSIIDENKTYKDRVIAIDHKTISVVERAMLENVSELLAKGVELTKIKQLIEDNAVNNRIYIAVDTLEYLKRGGRVNALSAAVGNILNIKPILFSNGNKFDLVRKARGFKVAEDEMLNFVLTDMNKMFPGEPIENFRLGVAYTECLDEAKKFKERVDEMFSVDAILDELSTVIGCHIGTGAVALAIYKKVNEG